MDVDKILAFHKRIEKSAKEPQVLKALAALIEQPNDINLQIDVLGCAHINNWLPNRKRALWEIFDIRSPEWIGAALDRIREDYWDRYACAALLGCPVRTVLSEVRHRSPEIVGMSMWDASDLHISTINFLKKNGNHLDNLFRITWDHKSADEQVVRIEHARRAVKMEGSGHPVSECLLLDWFWAELPYRFGYYSEHTVKMESVIGINGRDPVYARKMMQELGWSQ